QKGHDRERNLFVLFISIYNLFFIHLLFYFFFPGNIDIKLYGLTSGNRTLLGFMIFNLYLFKAVVSFLFIKKNKAWITFAAMDCSIGIILSILSIVLLLSNNLDYFQGKRTLSLSLLYLIPYYFFIKKHFDKRVST